MSITKCRVCNNNFFKEPLLQYENMPKSAQYLPDSIDKGINLEVVQCSGCGLVQLSNEVVSYYREVIRCAGISEEMRNFRLNQFKDFIGKYLLERKKIIEIGCGCGEYLSIMKNSNMNINVYGLEYSEKSVSNCIKDGLNVSKGFIETLNCKLENAPYDAFFMLNFLEHLPNLNLTLRGIYNNLNDDAIGLVEVPNFDMILKNNLFSEFVTDHLFYFNKETLSSTLKMNGFEIIEINDVWYNYIISAIVKKRKKIDISYFYKFQEQLKKEVLCYIDKFEYKKVAIWGAGHQSFTIISMLNLTDKIRYVIDSSTSKQGKYTPATHIPIVSPNTLNLNPVDAIIIIAASYSDEVSKIIRQNFDKNIKVSILRDFGLEER